MHEKPFAGINGSGKHNNWSLSTNTGVNLLDPGSSPMENAQFILFLTAIIKAVDEYQDLLRISIASAGNDHRLGANEAPPAIISIFLGEELGAVIDAIDAGAEYSQKDKEHMTIGVDVLPKFPKDNTDRNRTSPFAFTGNKFEFRAVGSAASIAGPNTVLNTIVAEALKDFADKLENSSNFTEDLNALIKETIAAHKRIIFNGNNYAEEWVVEAEKRGLLNLKSTVEALPYFISEKNIELFTKHGVYSESEMHSRYEINLESYCKILNIEALTMVEMATKEILPAVLDYVSDLSKTAAQKKAVSASISCEVEEKLLVKLSKLADNLYAKVGELESKLASTESESTRAEAEYYRNVVIPAMEELRIVADELETLVGTKYWPYPTYGEILFYN
jgi:glutamine synthetase